MKRGQDDSFPQVGALMDSLTCGTALHSCECLRSSVHYPLPFEFLVKGSIISNESRYCKSGKHLLSVPQVLYGATGQRRYMKMWNYVRL